ncbi:MAG: hypothetical protein AAB019_04175 [Planctomycetota bacterium]
MRSYIRFIGYLIGLYLVFTLTTSYADVGDGKIVYGRNAVGDTPQTRDYAVLEFYP